MKPESKFWKEWKKFTPNISWTRLENLSSFGTPDLLGYNKNHFFFTVELKVTQSNSVRLSPHQISYHVKHPTNTFILIQTRDACSPKLYPGACALELSQLGLAAPGACELASWSELERLLLEA